MRISRMITCGAVVALLLSGCASPLAPEDVTLEVAVEQPDELVVGDQVTIGMMVELPPNRTDSVEVVLEQRVAGAWNPVFSEGSQGPSSRASYTYEVDAEEGQEFRAVVLSVGDEPSILATSEVVALAPVDVEARMIQLFDDRNAAYGDSTQAGLDFDNRAVVPGFFDPGAPRAIAYAEGALEGSYAEVVTPDVQSLEEQQPFGWPGDNCTPEVYSGDLGRAFGVSVTVDTRYAQFTESRSDYRTLILVDGELYLFISNCA